MISCDQIELSINLYLDDMLPSEELPALKAHLEHCPECRAVYEQLLALKNAVAALDEPVPEALHERILTYVAENTRKPESVPGKKQLSFRRWGKALAAAAACGIIGITALYFGPQESGDAMEQLSNGAESSAMSNESVPDGALPEVPSASSDLLMTENAGAVVDMTEGTQEEHSVYSGQLSIDLPPMADEKQRDEARVIARQLVAMGPQASAPECLAQTTVYEGELDGEAVSYVEIAVFAQDYWLDQLAACGFTVTQPEDGELDADGQYIRLYFLWTE